MSWCVADKSYILSPDHYFIDNFYIFILKMKNMIDLTNWQLEKDKDIGIMELTDNILIILLVCMLAL